MTTACEMIACARQFVGVRFAHQGRSSAGLDCLGLLILTAKTLALTLDGQDAAALDITTYGTRPDAQLLKHKLDTHLLPVVLQEVREGDVLLLKIEELPQHLALVTDYPIGGELGMIHAYAPARKVIEHRYDAHWRNNSYAAYRLPHLA